MNFLKNPGPPKKELNKIGFVHYYEIVYTKKLLGDLWQWFINAIFIQGVWIFQKSWIFSKIQTYQNKG